MLPPHDQSITFEKLHEGGGSSALADQAADLARWHNKVGGDEVERYARDAQRALAGITQRDKTT
jgi:hypothetical protein